MFQVIFYTYFFKSSDQSGTLPSCWDKLSPFFLTFEGFPNVHKFIWECVLSLPGGVQKEVVDQNVEVTVENDEGSEVSDGD